MTGAEPVTDRRGGDSRARRNAAEMNRQSLKRQTPPTCHSEERSDVGISCNRLRFRRGLPAIQHGTARLPRRQRLLAMTRQGGEAVYQWPPAVEWPCTGRSLTAPTAAGAVGGNAPQKFAAAHGAHCAPPHHSAAFPAPGGACPSRTILHQRVVSTVISPETIFFDSSSTAVFTSSGTCCAAPSSP